MSTDLSRSLLAAFNAACNAKNLPIAEQLFAILDSEGTSSDALAPAEERLWLLRNLKCS
jgi:hypothetical protein